MFGRVLGVMLGAAMAVGGCKREGSAGVGAGASASAGAGTGADAGAGAGAGADTGPASPEDVCRHTVELSQGKEEAAKATRETLAACLGALETQQKDDPKGFVCFRDCVMSARTSEALASCEDKCDPDGGS